jgi:hypothetical protein
MPVQNFRVGEMLNKRTPNTKTWINFDGSYTTEIYQGLVHYQDVAGNLHNINTDLFDEADFDSIDFPVAKDGDSLFYEQKEKAIKDKKKNRLNREDYDFQGLKVPYEVKIPRNIRRGYSIGKGASKLKFIPVNASVSKGYVEGNKITYPDVWNDADLVLELLPEGIKETIILKTDKAPINFSFEVQGELAEELKIQPMWLMDAEGTKRDVLQGVSEVDGKTLMDIAADTSNLVYPIEIDPTVTIQPDFSVGKDAYVYENLPNNNYGTNTNLLIGEGSTGYKYLSFLDFDISSISGVVSDAKLMLFQNGPGGANNLSIYPGYALGEWDELTLTYSNKPNHIMLGPNIVATGSYPTLRTLDVTEIVTGWVNGTIPKYGFVLDTQTTTSDSRKDFNSSDQGSNQPKLEITYNAAPTAPVVTVPNGGETWNSLHTVEWESGYDVQEVNEVISTNYTSSQTINITSSQAQTFYISGGDYNLKNIEFRTGGTAYGAIVELWDVDVNGVPSSVLKSVNVEAAQIQPSPNFTKVNLDYSNLISDKKYAIVFRYYGGNYGLYVDNTAPYTKGEKYYRDTNVSSSWNLQNGYDVVMKINAERNNYNVQSQIQLSTDNGGVWKDIVALTTAGATSYAYDFINEAETSTALIRIRAYDGSAYGPWDVSDGVFTIVHNQAPTAPTGLSPSGIPKDRAATLRFEWVHNDPNSGDPQSEFDLQWRLQGSGTWNTVNQATPNNYYDMPAGTLPKGTIEWQIRTYDQAGLPSPYSSLTVFTAGDKPAAPTFVTPVDGATVAVSKPVVQWSSVGQTGYEVKVLDSTGITTLWTTGQVNSTNKAVTVGLDLENETDYQIQVLIKNADGLWSTAAVSNIHVSYTPPALPVLTTVVSDLAGSITVNIENPTPTGTEPNVSFNDLYRRETGGTWERIAANLASNGSYTDYTAASGQTYEYKVIATGDNETIRESLPVSDSINLKGIYLHVVQNAQSTSYRFLMGEQKSSSLWNLSHTFHKFAGRKNLVIDTEDATDYGVSFTLKLRTNEDIKALETIIYSQEVVCYRDSRGRKVFGVFVSFPMEDEFYGEATSLNLTKIDYKEEI